MPLGIVGVANCKILSKASCLIQLIDFLTVSEVAN